MRFGTTKSEMKLPFVSTLTFRYLCHYEDKIRFGVAKPETGFPFVSALTFSYLWELFYFLSVMKRGFIYTILLLSILLGSCNHHDTEKAEILYQNGVEMEKRYMPDSAVIFYHKALKRLNESNDNELKSKINSGTFFWNTTFTKPLEAPTNKLYMFRKNWRTRAIFPTPIGA